MISSSCTITTGPRYAVELGPTRVLLVDDIEKTVLYGYDVREGKKRYTEIAGVLPMEFTHQGPFGGVTILPEFAASLEKHGDMTLKMAQNDKSHSQAVIYAD